MKIVCIGDSLTEGDYGVPGKSGIANVHEKNYPFFLREMTGAEVVNRGFCGIRASGYWDYYRKGELDVSDADFVLVMLGTNGGHSATEETRDNLDYASLYAALLKDCKRGKVILVTPPHATENPSYSNCGSMPQIRDAVAFVRRFAKEQNANLIEAAEFGDFRPETEEKYQGNDGLHFIEAGYRRFAELMAKELKRF